MGDRCRTPKFFAGASVVSFACVLSVVSCAATERRPKVPPSGKVQELRRSAGDGVQDCGEAAESKTDTTCRVHSVGECIQAALKKCRPAFGMRSYFTSEGDAVRIDWLVLSDGAGGCKVTLVEDRSQDPLAPKKPSVQKCDSLEWKGHESIPNCEMPVAEGCHPAVKAELRVEPEPVGPQL